ncbi:hypothetical protein CQ054_04330, partial [Ochrobactrum sp. MYb29]
QAKLNQLFILKSMGPEPKKFAHCEFDLLVNEDDLDDSSYTPFFEKGVKVSKLFKREYGKGNISRFAFLPEKKGGKNDRVITNGNQTSINLYCPLPLPQEEGDLTQFFDFLEHLVPNEKERKHLIEWSGTLIAKPERRLMYGVLITSNMHGTGKSLFGDEILAPLVGEKYVSRPTGEQLAEKYTDWLFCKRLAIAEELYSGTSKKTYNGLKNKMTSRTIDHRTLYSAAITIENRITVYATSNGDRPLRLDDEDRRFCCLAGAEKKWGRDKFAALVDWIQNGGLHAVNYFFHHLEEYGYAYVAVGAEAPITERKKRLLEDSLSDTSREMKAVFQEAKDQGEPIIFFDGDLKKYVEQTIGQKPFEGISSIRRIAEPLGFVVGERMKKYGSMMYPISFGIEGDPKAFVDKQMRITEFMGQDEAVI